MYNNNDILSRDKWNSSGSEQILDSNFETSYGNTSEVLGWLAIGAGQTFVSKSANFSGSGFIYQRTLNLRS